MLLITTFLRQLTFPVHRFTRGNICFWLFLKNASATARPPLKMPCAKAIRIVTLLAVFFLLVSCAATGFRHKQRASAITETDYYIVFLVATKHLDYQDNEVLAQRLIRYSTRKGGFGHSWIYLKGIKDGERFVVEGGQSGQRGRVAPRFFAGVNNYLKYGYANPTGPQKDNPRYEPDPIKYLWEELNDGFYQKGNGGHSPTYAAKIDLTREQFEKILQFIDPATYPYGTYSLVGNQCSSFVGRVATVAGMEMEHEVTVQIKPSLTVAGKTYRLWTDPKYSQIRFSTPDMIENSLMRTVAQGRAEYALDWYGNR